MLTGVLGWVEETLACLLPGPLEANHSGTLTLGVLPWTWSLVTLAAKPDAWEDVDGLSHGQELCTLSQSFSVHFRGIAWWREKHQAEGRDATCSPTPAPTRE